MVRCFTPDGRQLWLVVPSTSLTVREDGRVEWFCPHGIGHPIGHNNQWEAWMGIHPCDGCKPPVPLFKES